MSEDAFKKEGRYLYAVIDGTERKNCGNIGIDGRKVYVIPNGSVSAVVSDIPDKKLRPERRNLAAHQEVLKKLMEVTTPLPVSFGIIADGPKAIQRILLQNQEALLGQLQRVADKVEMGVRVTWDVPNIFDYFVQTHPELKTARDRFFGTHREPTQEDKIELGRMFGRILDEDRDIFAEKVEEVLLRYCFEIKRNKCRNEQEVMNLACLVGQQAQGQFEEGIFEAAKLFDNNFAFDYSGPWAPHNFVDIDFKIQALESTKT